VPLGVVFRRHETGADCLFASGDRDGTGATRATGATSKPSLLFRGGVLARVLRLVNG